MSATTEQMVQVQGMKRALLRAFDCEAIILFGSLGRGEGDEFSDVDLLVVIETDKENKLVGEEMTRLLDPIARDKHVIVRRPMEFCRQKEIPGTLDFSALKEGRVLFEKAGWQDRFPVTDPYETRKREVARRDYLGEARDFLARAESSLERGNLYRCRDFARFAAARAMKGVLVLHDIHPPRELDLVLLLEKVHILEPALAARAAFLHEVNGYCPEGNGPREALRCRRMMDKMAAFLKELTGQWT